MAANQDRNIVLHNVRLGFPHLVEPSAAQADAKPRYGASLIIDPETPEGKKNIKKIEKAIERVESETFDKTGIKYSEDRCSYQDGNGQIGSESQEVHDGFQDMMCLKARNDKQPPILDLDAKTRLYSLSDKRFPQAGDYVNAVVSFYGIKPTDKSRGGKYGMFANLEAVQFRSEGERFGATEVDGSNYFENMATDIDDDDGGEDDNDDV